MNLLLVLPLLIPLFTGALCLLAWRNVTLQRRASMLGVVALFGAGLALLARVWNGEVLVTHVGNWVAPFGLPLVGDLLSAIMVALAGAVGVCVMIYANATIDSKRVHHGFYAMMHVLLLGICGSFLTGDLFNLFVWFEVMLMSSFALLALGGERAQLEGAIKYVALNLISSTIFLTAAGLTYAMAGTLNMADLAVKLPLVESSALVSALAMMYLVSFGIKAGLFPLFFWLPASYHTPPVAVSAIFAGLLTKVGVYALIRVFTLIFVDDLAWTHSILLWLAGLTMMIGVLGAVAQNDVRRILAFHSISQIGYMVAGLALYTPLALASALFYIVHHSVVKTNLFLLAGVIKRLTGSFDLSRTGGLYARAPLIGVLFLVPAFSLAGVPPFSGFFAKLILLWAALEDDQWIIAAVSLAAGVLTMFSMTKIWAGAFWKPLPDPSPGRGEAPPSAPPQDALHPGEPVASDTVAPEVTAANAQSGAVGELQNDPVTGEPRTLRHRAPRAMLTPIAVMALGAIALGVTVEPLIQVSLRAADQLLDRRAYVSAVLGDQSAAALAPPTLPRSAFEGQAARVRQGLAPNQNPLGATRTSPIEEVGAR